MSDMVVVIIYNVFKHQQESVSALHSSKRWSQVKGRGVDVHWPSTLPTLST
jgi:hypothetical protein